MLLNKSENYTCTIISQSAKSLYIFISYAVNKKQRCLWIYFLDPVIQYINDSSFMYDSRPFKLSGCKVMLLY